MGRIYDSNGWVNWEYIVSQGCAFNMIVGARGVGKTYGLMKYCIQNDRKFIYLRRLKSQLDQCATGSGNPFKKLNSDMDLDIKPHRKKGGVVYGIDCEENEDEEIKTVAVGVALSTVANVRGFDFSDYDLIVFDEAIASEGERPIAHEFTAFLNFYETVNRNRELLNEKPVQVFLLGNANRLANPYFSGWHFTRTALNMLKGHQMVWRSNDNSRMMIILQDSVISERKKETALYKNANEGFLSMAIDNAFRVDSTNIKSMPLKEFTHLVSVGDIGIYRHKSQRLYYVSFLTNKECYYDGYGITLKMFQQDFYNLRLFYLVQKIVYFENYEAELLFRDIFDLT